MKKLILLASLLSVTASAALAQGQLETYSVYDVNHDNVTNVGDATMAARRAIQNIQDDPQTVDAAQLNAVLNAINEKLAMLDVLNQKVNEMMAQSGMRNPYEVDENGVRSAGYGYVDMGLRDDQDRIVYWATCNIGAEKPEEQGLLFAWGDTQGHTTNSRYNFLWENYKFMFEGESTEVYITKYTVPDGHKNAIWYEDYNATRFVGDNKTRLEPIDDAAHVNWKGDWRMPTYDELNWLYNECNWALDEAKQVMVVTSPYTNASIYFPYTSSYYCTLWTSDLSPDSTRARLFNYDFKSEYSGHMSTPRYHGINIRPVCVASE